jgi:hypothetical protein
MTTVFCEACQIPVDKNHLARHRRSQLHLRALGSNYIEKASDDEFRRFLANVRPEKFSESEMRIYIRARKDSMRGTAAWVS